MKKGYSRQHPGAAIVFVGKGGTVHRSIVPKPLAIDQKNLITEVKYSFTEFLLDIKFQCTIKNRYFQNHCIIKKSLH